MADEKDIPAIAEPKVPQVGDPLTLGQIDTILESLSFRQANFEQETLGFSLAVVLASIGNRYAPVTCVAGEWSGLKQDLPKREDPLELPKCPNGHVLMEGKGVRLGWIQDF